MLGLELSIVCIITGIIGIVLLVCICVHAKRHGITCMSTVNQLHACFTKNDDQENNARTTGQEKTKVQLWISNPKGTTDKFAAALQREMCTFDWIIAAKEKLGANLPLVVLCQRCSRLQADVERDTTGCDRFNRYAVIIIHTGSEKNMPMVASAGKINIEGKTVTFIDMGLDEYGRFHECELNNEAKLQLQGYINAFVPESHA